MRIPKTIQYCVPADVMKLLQQDGLGWGHDLNGCTFAAPQPPQEAKDH